MLEKLFSRAGCKKEAAWARFVFQWLAVSFILHIIAAVRSTGFFHSTEHLRILELVNYKLGRSTASDLPPEYHQMILPWLLPALMTGITDFLNTIGVKSPFDWAVSYRLLAALLGWLATVGLTLCCYLWFVNKDWRKWAVISLNLIWYLPAFHARPSAESMGGSVFFIGLSLLLLASPPLPKLPAIPGKSPLGLLFCVGLLFGTAFEIKFDTGIMTLGVLFWLLFIARNSAKFSAVRTFALLSGFAVAVLMGAWADHWGYGQWTFTPLNFLHSWAGSKVGAPVSVLSGSFHPSVWQLFKETLALNWPPLGTLVFLSFLLAWCRHPKHILTWCTVPLFLCISSFSSTQLLQLFPMIHIGGLMLILSVEKISFEKIGKFVLTPIQRDWLQWTKWAAIGLNLVALIMLTTTPAWIPIRFYSRLYTFKPYKFQVNYKDNSLFQIDGKTLKFYLPTDVAFNQIHDYSDLVRILSEQESTQWLFNPQHTLPDSAEQLKKWCKPEFSTLPDWMGTGLEKANTLVSSNSLTNWTLYRCQSPNLLRSTLEETEN